MKNKTVRMWLYLVHRDSRVDEETRAAATSLGLLHEDKLMKEPEAEATARLITVCEGFKEVILSINKKEDDQCCEYITDSAQLENIMKRLSEIGLKISECTDVDEMLKAYKEKAELIKSFLIDDSLEEVTTWKQYRKWMDASSFVSTMPASSRAAVGMSRLIHEDLLDSDGPIDPTFKEMANALRDAVAVGLKTEDRLLKHELQKLGASSEQIEYFIKWFRDGNGRLIKTETVDESFSIDRQKFNKELSSLVDQLNKDREVTASQVV